jgi:hypothetical protein
MPNLVFALRHRFYFDYLLSNALLVQLEHALAGQPASTFVDWMLRQHVADSFSTCLDFLPWHTRVAKDGVARFSEFFAQETGFDEVLGSYLASLALAVFLRRDVGEGERLVSRLRLDHKADAEILLVKELLPNEVSQLTVAYCSFPQLILEGMDLRSVKLDSCEFKRLRLCDMTISESTFGIDTPQLELTGKVTFSRCCLDVRGEIGVAEDAEVRLFECQLSDGTFLTFRASASVGRNVLLSHCKRMEVTRPEERGPTNGRRFVNKLMVLLRKEGHAQFGVYYFKLRAMTPGTDEQFAAAVDILESAGIVRKVGDMVLVTKSGMGEMYDPRLMGGNGYDSKAEFWNSVVHDLDSIIGT